MKYGPQSPNTVDGATEKALDKWCVVYLDHVHCMCWVALTFGNAMLAAYSALLQRWPLPTKGVSETWLWWWNFSSKEGKNQEFLEKFAKITVSSALKFSFLCYPPTLLRPPQIQPSTLSAIFLRKSYPIETWDFGSKNGTSNEVRPVCFSALGIS